MRLDQDILTPLAGKKKLYTFETNDFWEQIKTPGWVMDLAVLSLLHASLWKFVKFCCTFSRSFNVPASWGLIRHCRDVIHWLYVEEPCANIAEVIVFSNADLI